MNRDELIKEWAEALNRPVEDVKKIADGMSDENLKAAVEAVKKVRKEDAALQVKKAEHFGKHFWLNTAESVVLNIACGGALMFGIWGACKLIEACGGAECTEDGE